MALGNEQMKQKVTEIKAAPSSYNKSVMGKQEASKDSKMLGSALKLGKKDNILEQNWNICKRLAQVQSTIKFDQLDREFKQHKSFLKKTRNPPNKIYNCFLYVDSSSA